MVLKGLCCLKRLKLHLGFKGCFQFVSGIAHHLRHCFHVGHSFAVCHQAEVDRVHVAGNRNVQRLAVHQHRHGVVGNQLGTVDVKLFTRAGYVGDHKVCGRRHSAAKAHGVGGQHCPVEQQRIVGGCFTREVIGLFLG